MGVLREVYEVVPDDYETYSEQQQGDIDYLLDRYNLLGSLVHQGIVDKKLALEAYGGAAILRCWYQLVRYVRNQQERRRYYAEDFENLAYYTWKYFKYFRIHVAFSNSREVRVDDLVSLFDKLAQDKDSRFLCPRSMNQIRLDRRKVNR
jgi:hypothetical protein